MTPASDSKQGNLAVRRMIGVGGRRQFVPCDITLFKPEAGAIKIFRNGLKTDPSSAYPSVASPVVQLSAKGSRTRSPSAVRNLKKNSGS
jgi:hypothetical protein